MLKSIKYLGNEPVALWLPEKYIEPGTSRYVQGVEAPMDYDGPELEGFETIVLPKSKYIMLQGEPFLEEEYLLAIDAVKDAISKYVPETIGWTWDDESPRIQLEPIAERGYIELMAVKACEMKKK